jgi:Tol biopolymer transport system component
MALLVFHYLAPIGSWIELASLDGSGRTRLTRLPRRGEVRDVSDPVWSPDGSKLVYLVSFGNVEVGGSRSSLYVVNADGTGRHRLVSWRQVGRGIGNVSWAPDGSQLAFDVERQHFDQHPSHVALYTVNVNGSAPRRLPALPGWPGGRNPVVDLTPVGWSVDNRNLLYTADVYRDDENGVLVIDGDLYRMDLETLGRTRLRSSEPPEEYVLSPSGAQMAAFSEADRLLLLDGNAGSSQQLFTASDDALIRDAAWLGDSSVLFYMEGPAAEQAQLSVIDIETRELRDLVDETAYVFSDLAVSRDASSFVFVLDHLGADPSQLRVMSPDGETLATFPAPTQPGSEVVDYAFYLNPR